LQCRQTPQRIGPAASTREATRIRRPQPHALLYLVVEEKPPLDPTVRIRTYLPVPINPTKMWYAAYSRTGRQFVPAG
jgi:hypothetical protein